MTIRLQTTLTRLIEQIEKSQKDDKEAHESSNLWKYEYTALPRWCGNILLLYIIAIMFDLNQTETETDGDSMNSTNSTIPFNLPMELPFDSTASIGLHAALLSLLSFVGRVVCL